MTEEYCEWKHEDNLVSDFLDGYYEVDCCNKIVSDNFIMSDPIYCIYCGRKIKVVDNEV